MVLLLLFFLSAPISNNNIKTTIVKTEKFYKHTLELKERNSILKSIWTRNEIGMIYNSLVSLFGIRGHSNSAYSFQGGGGVRRKREIHILIKKIHTFLNAEGGKRGLKIALFECPLT